MTVSRNGNQTKEENKIMFKPEFIKSVAAVSGVKEKDVAAVVNACGEVIKSSLKKGEPVKLVGFGTFSVTTRKAHLGRNPHTGERLEIAESKTPHFTAGIPFREEISEDKS